MSHSNENHVPDELQHVVERLRQERPEATAMELDQIKLRAMARAKDAPSLASSGKGGFMKSRLVGVMLAVGMLAGGGGAMAVTGTDTGILQISPLASDSSQYCPPKSPKGGEGKPPHPARCGTGPKP
jgi:hypothetical protein